VHNWLLENASEAKLCKKGLGAISPHFEHATLKEVVQVTLAGIIGISFVYVIESNCGLEDISADMIFSVCVFDVG